MSWILLFSTCYADIQRNSNSWTFSWNIHFEVKYLKNGLTDYSDTYMAFFSSFGALWKYSARSEKTLANVEGWLIWKGG